MLSKSLHSLCLLSILVFSSCTSINSVQKKDVEDFKVKNQYVEEKKPELAAALNILPGIGNFYNGEIGYGILNLISWPLSVLWAPIGAYDGALVKNWEASRQNIERQAYLDSTAKKSETKVN